MLCPAKKLEGVQQLPARQGFVRDRGDKEYLRVLE